MLFLPKAASAHSVAIRSQFHHQRRLHRQTTTLRRFQSTTKSQNSSLTFINATFIRYQRSPEWGLPLRPPPQDREQCLQIQCRRILRSTVRVGALSGRHRHAPYSASAVPTCTQWRNRWFGSCRVTEAYSLVQVSHAVAPVVRH